MWVDPNDLCENDSDRNRSLWGGRQWLEFRRIRHVPMDEALKNVE